MTVLTRSMRVVEAEESVYRRTWRGTVISSFVNPVFSCRRWDSVSGRSSTPAAPTSGCPT